MALPTFTDVKNERDLKEWLFQASLIINQILPTAWLANRKAVTGNHTVLPEETLIAADTTSSALTVTLPLDLPAGSVVVIQDEGGNAGTLNITIAAGSGNTLQGVSSIASHYGRAVAYCDGAGTWYSA